MSVPANHLAAIDSQEAIVARWIEIEGLPYGYGNFTAAAAFFATRAVTSQLLGIKPYLMKTPKTLDQSIDTLEGGSKTAGAVNFELGDIDGSIVQLCGVGYQTNFTSLTAEINDTVTTIPIPAGSGGGFAAGGYCYIGTETIKIGAVGAAAFTGCTRGMFRSKAQAFGIGIPIGTRPYAMANRKCWYNQIARSGHATRSTLDTTVSEAEACVRFGGQVVTFVMDTPNTWTIQVHSMDTELDRQVFRSLKYHKLRMAIMSADPQSDTSDEGAGQIQVPGWKGYALYGASIGYGNNRDLPCPLDVDGLPLYAPGTRRLVRIDNEIFMVLSLANQQLEYQQRAMCGTKPEKHSAGAIVQELVTVCEYRNSFGFEWTAEFNAVCPTDVHADHPLAIVLQILTSKIGNGANGNYDTLPPDWGLGIDVARVDVAGIELAMLEEPTLRFGGVIKGPENFLMLARELLAFCGYYHYVAIGDLFRIKRLRPPEPDTESLVREILPKHRIRDRPAKWDANWSGAIREVVFRYAYDMVLQDYKIIDIYKLAGGELYSKGLARTLTYESSLLYPGKSGIPGEPPFERFDVRSWLLTRAEFFKVRYGRPPPIVTEYLTYEFIDLEVGDVVLITNPLLPSTATGALGMTTEVGEIISISIDDNSKTVEARILMTGYQLGSYRYIAPTLEIHQDNGSFIANNVHVEGKYEANSFSAPVGQYGNTQNDGKVENSTGTIVQTFTDLTHVRIWSEDFYDYIDADPRSFDPDTRDFYFLFPGVSFRGLGGAAFFPAYTNVFWVTFQNYDSVTADDWSTAVYPELGPLANSLNVQIPDRYAFGAGVDDKLGAGGDAGDKWFPT